MEVVVLRPAQPDEAETLSTLALRSKGHWGYDEAFLAACRAELTISADYLQRGETFVLDCAGLLLGFHALRRLDADRVELDFLFVEPSAIGQGYGRRLVEHAKQRARQQGYSRMLIQGDPNAGSFYRAAGGREVGTLESLSIPGRQLPLFEIDLSAARALRRGSSTHGQCCSA